MADRWTIRELARMARRGIRAGGWPTLSPEKLDRVKRAEQEGDVDYLLTSLDNPGRRPFAVRSLGRMRAVAAVPALMELAETRPVGARARDIASYDSAEVSRVWAIEALGQIGDDRAAPTLVSLLGDDSFQVTMTAAKALDDLGDPRGRETVLRNRRAERFLPRFLRARRPGLPPPPLVAATLAVAWAAATVGLGWTTGVWAWTATLLVAGVFRELWLRARERAAQQLGLVLATEGVELPRSARLTAVGFGTAAAVAVGFVAGWVPALLSVFVLAQRIGLDRAERSAYAAVTEKPR